MLRKLLSLLPVSIVRELGNSSFANLQERGEIKTWMVGYTKDSSLPSDNQSNDLMPGNYHYLGLQIRIISCYREKAGYQTKYYTWYVYDGHGSEVIADGESVDEETAIANAKRWIKKFVNDDEE